MGHLMLVTGGARSGKSAFAEERLSACPGPHGYIATAPIYDAEMAARVKAHQRRRPASWQTYEVPEKLPDILPEIFLHERSVLLDCVTLYFSTYLFTHREMDDEAVVCGALKEMEHILDVFRTYTDRNFIIVTNEIGCGIVPMEHVSRLYRDLIGKINQYVAGRADEVYLVACGLPLCLKGEK